MAGGGIYQSGGHLSISGNSWFSSCAAMSAGGGLYLNDPKTVSVDATFFGNNAPIGSSIYIYDPAPAAAISINYGRIYTGTVVIQN